jgi:tetratricopeptide (TPR) repeat protein
MLLFVIIGTNLFAQSPLRITGIEEPPELTGEPKQVKQVTDAERGLLGVVGKLKDETQAGAALPTLDRLIQNYPNYSDAYFLRAYVKGCILNSKDFVSLRADIEQAKAHPDASVYNESDYESLLAKLSFERSDLRGSIEHLEKAMMKDVDNADQIFNIEGIEPERKSKFCVWNLSNLDALVAMFSSDYRVWLFRGLYYEFFTTFKEDYYQKASENFYKAALLNPKSPLPDYFIGHLYSKASFWTKKAWASDAGRDEPIKNSIQAYSRAIQLDSKFWQASEHRASGYLALKRYSEAIKDFDLVLKLKQDYASAYSDRGIAKLQSGHYFAAISDFDEAIRLKKDGDSFLSNLFEYRGDANSKLHQYKDAINDYSHAIEQQVANITFLISLKQFRGIYPEYENVPDEMLLRKLNVLFWPQFEYKVFTEQIEKNGGWSISLINELYEKRGDAYLRAGDFRRCVLDFKRIFKGIPNFADTTDRWRLLGQGNDGETYYLDVKTAEFSRPDFDQIWIKSVGNKGTETVAYEIDCNGKRLSAGSTASYDSAGKLLRSSDVGSSWQQIVPDTIGEQLYSGTCSGKL